MSGAATSPDEAGRAMRPATAASPDTGATVKVWDPFVRVFHWSLVVLFGLAFLTSEVSEKAHIWIGYAILALVGLRIVWGFIGSRHARFGDFVYRPSAVLAYLRDAVHLRAKRYLGHNPAGGAMVLALIAALLAVSGTGILMTLDRFWGVKWIEEVHEAAAFATLALVGLHVAGVLFSSLEHRENLVRSMLTGRKRAPDA